MRRAHALAAAPVLRPPTVALLAVVDLVTANAGCDSMSVLLGEDNIRRLSPGRSPECRASSC
jgi:hypothetical protein